MHEMTFRPGFAKVLFDCDGTLSSMHGMSALAALCGVKGHKTDDPSVVQAVAAIARKEMHLAEVLTEYIDALAPTKGQVEGVGEQYVAHVVDCAHEVVQALQYLGKEIYVLSYGFRDALLPFAAYLGIPSERVVGIELVYDKHGKCQGLAQGQTLLEEDGKRRVIEQLFGGVQRDTMLFVGDGALDLCVQDVVGMFVGYGGVSIDKIVKKQAKYFLTSPSLLPILFVATSMMEKTLLQSTDYAELVVQSFVETEEFLRF